MGVTPRYADDIVIHCETQEQSEQIERALAARMQECKLSLHPEKTKVVYCKDESRNGWYPTKKFTFLGYTFQPRSAQNRATKRVFTRFLPAVSTASGKKFRTNLKRSRLLIMRHLSLDEFAQQLNQRVRGWYGYFSHFYPSALYRTNDWLDAAIVRWLRSKYAVTWTYAQQLLNRLARSNPQRFAHWLFRLPGRAV
jgi:RNA-directed DNA polymerase